MYFSYCLIWCPSLSLYTIYTHTLTHRVPLQYSEGLLHGDLHSKFVKWVLNLSHINSTYKENRTCFHIYLLPMNNNTIFSVFHMYLITGKQELTENQSVCICGFIVPTPSLLWSRLWKMSWSLFSWARRYWENSSKSSKPSWFISLSRTIWESRERQWFTTQE